MPANEVRVSEWIVRGISLYKNNFILLVATHFVAVMLGVVSVGILAGPMLAGLYVITLRLVDDTEPRPEVGDLFDGFRYFFQPVLFVLVWWGLAIAVASVALNTLLGHLPTVGPLTNAIALTALEALTMFGIPLIVDRDLEFWPASTTSISHVWSRYGAFIALAFVSRLLSTSGVFLYGFGLFLTLPVHTCIIAVAFRESFATLDGRAVSDQREPSGMSGPGGIAPS